MFAFPGILALVVFLVGRPFDLVPSLQGLPLLYLFCGVAIFGYLVDVRLGFSTLPITRQLILVIGFVAWCLLSVVLQAPWSLLKATMSLAILFIVYVLLAHGVRTFRAFEVLAGTVLACALWIGLTCIHLRLQPKECVAYWPGETPMADLGHPDGRLCDTNQQCREGGDSGSAYSCEHAGAFGMTSVERRVRYVGTLQDPNEVALFVSAALPFAFAFYQRKRTRRRLLFAALAFLVVAMTVKFTQSRGGMLVLLSVLGFYAVQRYGVRQMVRIGIPLGLALAVVFLVLSAGPEREHAEASTEKRIGCLKAGLEMFTGSPVFGAGFDQFTQHHDQTAHNSYLLAASELGFFGMILWATIYYLAVKTMILALRRCQSPESQVARIWGLALNTSLIGLSVGVFFLSFTYHYVLWIYLGLAGAFYAAVHTHDRDWHVPLGWRDLVVIAGGCLAVLVAVFVYTSLKA